MRDVALTLILLGIFPLILYRPHIGILAWAWVAFMNPHREVYSYLAGANLNMAIAALTLLSLIFSNEKWFPRINTTIFTLLMFVSWTFISTYYSLQYDTTSIYMLFYLRIFVFLLLLSMLIDRPSRIHAFVIIIIVSVGYWGVVNALQTLASLGNARITGPANSMISDNNHLALALNIVIPLTLYGYKYSASKIIGLSFLMIMLCSIVTIIGTYSRGGFITLIVVLSLLAWQSKHRLLFSCSAAIFLTMVILFVPQKWTDRMATIETMQSDRSFQSRLDAWRTAWRIAVDRPIVGGGYKATENKSIFARYNPERQIDRGWAVHNAYLQVLSEHGFVGLSLYLMMLIFAISNCRWIRKRCASLESMKWICYLANMMIVSFIGFAVGSAALSVAYYNVLLALVILSAILKDCAKREIEFSNPSLKPVH